MEWSVHIEWQLQRARKRGVEDAFSNRAACCISILGISVERRMRSCHKLVMVLALGMSGFLDQHVVTAGAVLDFPTYTKDLQ